jgi:hypothetical protein
MGRDCRLSGDAGQSKRCVTHIRLMSIEVTDTDRASSHHEIFNEIHSDDAYAIVTSLALHESESQENRTCDVAITTPSITARR